jgi:outer membrane protein OmpA-like peptidoglycan-associated protein
MTISATNGATTVSCSYVIGSATSCTLPTLTDGVWNVTATLTDTAGNNSPASAALALTIDTRRSAASVGPNSAGGLPSSSIADTQLQITTGPNSMTGRIRFAPHAAAHGATSVVFTVYNTSGKIVSVITRRVKPTDKSASITVGNDGSLSTIRAHTTNKTGVSVSARTGANVMRGRTSQGTMADGRPILRGTAIGETIFFRGDSAALTPRTTAILDKVAKSINTKGGRLFVSGFARKNGLDTPKYLRDLSVQRALAVSMYLSSKGVRLWTVYQGFGAVTKEIGTPQERRVEINWRTL